MLLTTALYRVKKAHRDTPTLTMLLAVEMMSGTPRRWNRRVAAKDTEPVTNCVHICK